MTWLQALLLAIMQGATELFPVSSLGHAVVVPDLLNWAVDERSESFLPFVVVMHFGTAIAMLLFFWRDLVRILSAWFHALYRPEPRGTLDARMGWYLIYGTIPIAVLGLLFKDQIETGARDLRLIGWVLILFGVVLWLVDRVFAQSKTLADLGLRDGLLFGLAQALALIPGVSRSGATITAGRALNYTREDAARFSFLLSVPAVVLSGLFEARKVGEAGGPAWGPTILATIVAFAVGYAAIAWLLRWLTHHSMLVFAVYRVGLGVIVLLLVYGGHIAATS